MKRILLADVGTATLILIFCAMLFGLVPLFARILMAEGMDHSAIALARYGVTALVVLPFLPLRRGARREVAVLAAAGFAMGLGWVSYLSAIERGSVAAAGVVYMSYPVWALLFAWLLAGIAPGARGLAAAAMVLSAALLIAGPGAAGADARTLLMSLPAPAFFGLVIVALVLLAPSLRPVEKTAAAMLGALAGLLPLAAMAEPGTLLPASGAGWAALAGMGVLTALVPQMLFVVAAAQVGPGRAAAAGAFELPVMVAIGALAFGEALGPREAVAAALVMLAIGLSPAVRPRAGAA